MAFMHIFRPNNVQIIPFNAGTGICGIKNVLIYRLRILAAGNEPKQALKHEISKLRFEISCLVCGEHPGTVRYWRLITDFRIAAPGSDRRLKTNRTNQTNETISISRDPPYNNQLAGNAALFSRPELTEVAEASSFESKI
jgi:hypothetical protein